MKSSLFSSVLLAASLLVASVAPVSAQKRGVQSANGSLPWFTVVNKRMMVQTGSSSKILAKDVTLPNGSRVEYQTQSVVLANGTRVHLKEGDLLSLNGELIQKSPANVAPPADATASITPVASPVPNVMTATATPPAPAPVAAAVAPVLAAAPAATPAFTYRPEAPVNGKLKGVVELGASGFNMFIVRIDSKRNWKTEKVEYGNSLVMENMATEADIRIGLKAYIGQMLDFGVDGRDIHFVVSSGAAMVPSTLRIVKGLQALKYVVTTVTPEREGALALRAALPPGFSDKAFVVDMGSANTKISWLTKGQPQVQDTYGSKYFEKGVDDAIVAAEVKAKAAQVPAQLRGTCFVIGGVPYELAKTVRQGTEPFTVLHSPTNYSELKGAKIKSGLNIYQAVAEATGCKQFVFGYDTPFTIGYLLSL
jgi:hypothetical protein